MVAVADQAGRRRKQQPPGNTSHAATGRHGNPEPAADQPPDNETRLPPHDLDAERAVLGVLLLGQLHLTTEARQLLPDGHDWFYDPLHARIWRLICHLANQDVAADPVTVADAARLSGERWREPDDTLYLHELHNHAPVAPQLAHHAAIVARYEVTRRLDLLAIRMRQAVATGDQQQLIGHAQTLRDDLNQALAAQGPGLALDTWTPLDLEPALSGGIITQPPTVLAREDGIFLLYMGRLHSLSGEPEAGKTWVALIAACQALEDNQHVICLDFEDTPEGIVGRLLALGAHPDWIRARLHYIRPDRAIDDQARQQLRQLIENNFTTLAIIDGVTEAMTLHGLAPLDNTEAAIFYEQLPRFITRLPAPPAVLMIDHVPKDDDRPKRYAIGAQHKLAGLDGAAYMVDIVTPFAPGQPGISKIRVAKDRPGQVRKHSVKGVIAELHVHGGDEVVKAELHPPAVAEKTTGPDGHWRPTILMEKVSRFVEAHPGAGQNEIEKAVHGKAQNIRAALEALMLEQFVDREQGPRRALLYRIVTPFRNSPEDEVDLDD